MQSQQSQSAVVNYERRVQRLSALLGSSTEASFKLGDGEALSILKVAGVEPSNEYEIALVLPGKKQDGHITRASINVGQDGKLHGAVIREDPAGSSSTREIKGSYGVEIDAVKVTYDTIIDRLLARCNEVNRVAGEQLRG